MGRAVGIDLGTVNSCVAVLDEGKPRVLQDKKGGKFIPSVFAIDNADNFIVGSAAEEQSHMNRENTIFAVKRLIGLKFESDEVQGSIKKLPYPVVEAPNGDAWVRVQDKNMSPIEVSSFILRHIRSIAEEALGEEVDKAVITCPAHFNDAQRQATRDAGRIAGLEVLGIINEQTAAALAYGMDRIMEEGNDSLVENKDKIIAVFDLGGGTFDISILRLHEGQFYVMSTNGDTYLGGEDFDLAIVNTILWMAKHHLGSDLTKDTRALQRVKKAAKEAKHTLSEVKKMTIELPFIAGGMRNLNLPTTRKDLETMVTPLLKRLDKPCFDALEDAEITQKDVTDVILVGGMTRMPAVKYRSRDIFKCIPHDGVDPDAAVALGAAVYSGIVLGDIDGLTFQDVIPLSLGLEIQGGQVYRILRRNAAIPTEVTKVFTTSAPNQNQVSVHILQGEDKFAPNNTSLGRFELEGIKTAPRGEPEFAITFAVDPGGIVHVAAQDLDTGEKQKVDISPSAGLTEEEVQHLIKTRKAEEEQAKRLANRQSQSEAQQKSDEEKQSEALKNLLFLTQFNLDTQGTSYIGQRRKELEEAISNARKALESGQPQSISETLKLLEDQAAKLEAYIEEDN